MNAIVIDDNKIELQFICDLAVQSSVHINISATFSNGKDALDYLKQNHVDLIISDIQMPEMTGIELSDALNNYNINAKLIFVSCYDDYKYLKKAIENDVVDYVLKPIIRADFEKAVMKAYHLISNNNNALQKQEIFDNALHTAKPIMTEKFFSDYIIYHNIDEKTFERSLKLYDISQKKYKAIAFCHTSKENQHYPSLIGIKDYCTSLSSSGISIQAILKSDNEIILVLMFDDEEETLFPFVCNLRDDIAARFFVNLRFGLSSVTTQISKLHQIYKEAVEASQYYNCLSCLAIGIYNEHEIDVNSIVSKIEAILTNKDTKNLKSFLTHSISNQPADYIQRFVYCYIYSIETILNQSGKSLEIYLGNSVWNKLNDVKKIANHIEWLYNITVVAVDLSCSNVRHSKKELTQLIKDIIERDYSKKLTLSSVASELHYSVNYLSSIFSEETDMTFLEYLTVYRMDIAKKLLAEPDSKIYLVAEQVGYKRKSHFYNVFYKYTGYTPAEYKKNFSST